MLNKLKDEFFQYSYFTHLYHVFIVSSGTNACLTKVNLLFLRIACNRCFILQPSGTMRLTSFTVWAVIPVWLQFVFIYEHYYSSIVKLMYFIVRCKKLTYLCIRDNEISKYIKIIGY